MASMNYFVLNRPICTQVLRAIGLCDQKLLRKCLVAAAAKNGFIRHLVWDIIDIINNSLKGIARAKCEKGVRRHVVAESAIPRNWHDFLRADSSKAELFRFLSHALLKSFDQEDKQLVVTDEESVLSNAVMKRRITA